MSIYAEAWTNYETWELCFSLADGNGPLFDAERKEAKKLRMAGKEPGDALSRLEKMLKEKLRYVEQSMKDEKEDEFILSILHRAFKAINYREASIALWESAADEASRKES